MVTKGGQWWEETNQEVGIDIYTLLGINQIISKDLLFSTGNTVSCNYNRRESERIDRSITESLCCIPETDTALVINYTSIKTLYFHFLLVCVCVCVCVCARTLVTQSCTFFVTPWTVAYQAPLSMGTLQARILEWVAISFSRGSS